ncbi:MAG: ABC transporter permease [Gemmatimonadota bacterium]|nr:ABC transporter permease [Gemmatimonadota bacterium]
MLIRRPLRSLLIVVGVAVGVGALLVAEAVAERGRREALNEIATMGADVVIISAEASQNRGGRARSAGIVPTLTSRDAGAILDAVAGVKQATSEFRGTAPVKMGSLARQATVAGVDASYARLRESPMARGRFFGNVEALASQRVVVVGAQLAEDLGAGRNLLGDNLWIRGMPFRIVGILRKRGTGLDAFDEDAVAFVPLRTAQRRLFQVAHIERIFLRIDESATSLADAVTAIVALLSERHHLLGEPGGNVPSADFRVDTQLRLVDMRQATASRLRQFQAGAALLLLAVGAGGTFALQQLAVRERMSEIGVRRAVGATRFDVFLQFVVEAGAVSAAGGLLGVMVARAAGALMSTAFSLQLAGAAFGACVLCCVCAACVPVWRVVRKQPTDALHA